MSQLKVIADKLNKRKQIPVALPDDGNISGVVFKNYSFEGSKVATNALGDWYVDRDNNFYWGKGLTVLPNVAAAPVTAPVTTQSAIPSFPPADLHNLPLNQSQCLTSSSWLNMHFGDKVTALVAGTPYTKELIYAIACQETACVWYHWISDHTPDEVLGRCVFDASGDANGTREAFPRNTAAFIEKMGQPLADMLIAEANATRALHGWSPKQWVYAGYGIFQYDIQAILYDADFFEKKMWYSIDACLTKVLAELNSKWRFHPNDLFSTVKAYNGAGPRADNYARNVFQFWSWIKSEL